MSPGSTKSSPGLGAHLALLLPPNKRKLLGALALAAAAGYAAQQYAEQKNRKAKARAVAPGGALAVAGGAAPRSSKRRPSGQALKELIPLLLRLVGRKVIVLALLAVARTALANRLARLQGYLFRAAFLRRVPLFARNLVENVVLCGVASGLEATSRSWVAYMELQWRCELTRRVHSAYFGDMTYYKLSYVDRRVDSPEQRICEDIPKLSAGLADLTRELICAAVDAAFFSWQLRSYTGTNRYTGAILAYVFGAGTFMAVAAPNFGGLFKRQQAVEGSYRHLHTRLQANAESIAFYNGIAKEGQLLRARFREVVAHASRVLGAQWKFSMVQDFLLKYFGATVAVALIIGPFFSGHMRPEATVAGRAQMLSNMRYHTSVIISLFAALGTLGASSRKFLKLSAYADRIAEMQRVMDEIKHGAAAGAMGVARGEVLPSEDAIVFEGATVVTPGNATLVRELSLSVPSGTNLLVTGPNGAGKSSLFRVLGGLWPLTQGRIYKPGGGGGAAEGLSHDIFYVPQRPYVTVGTLQDQLLYPRSADVDCRIPEPELRALLRCVDLESLLDRAGGGEEVTNWGEVLSLGEQQRLGMARLFFHRPRFAILDECTSGVTVDMEERFCEMVKNMGCTCITISHRPALMAFHDVVLNLDGEGGWGLHPGHRSLGAAQSGSSDGCPAFAAEGGGAKVRSAEAQAVLQGMTAATKMGTKAAVEALGDGNEGYSELVIARSPANCGSRAALSWAPRFALQPSLSTPLARWRSVIRVLMGGDGRQSAAHVSAVAGVVVLRTLLQDRIASLNGRSVDLVLRQDLPGFLRLIGVSVLQSAASAVLAPSLRHVADLLALSWRARLTKAVAAKYLSGTVFYAVSQLGGMQDVDQRITRDVERLCDDLSALIPTLVKPIVDVAWFSWQLWRLTGPRGMAIMYAYIAVGYGSLRAVTPDFGGLLKREYALEGAFRNAHSRLRAHAESVAFFGGGVKEGSLIAATFGAHTHHLRSLIWLRWAYGAADEFFAKQLPHSITWVLTLLYSLEQRGNFGDTAFQGALVHNIRYLASVVTQCFTAFGELLALPKRFAEISGGINRVSEMLEVVDKGARMVAAAKAAAATAAEEDESAGGAADCIEFRGVDVVTPGGKVLARQLTLRVSPGASLLVTGPNGAGKTSLFRLLGALWPLPSGAVHKPGRAGEGLDTADIYCVPQKPYTTIGTLREQVIYPLTLAQAHARFAAPAACGTAVGWDPGAALDEALTALTGVVRLRYLLEREGGWGATKEWGEVLSLGEQQRLGMARLFFHRPRFGVLDEATNATSVDVEEALYAHSRALGITLVTITQRTALVKYHARELRLIDGEGDWELRVIKQVAAVANGGGGGGAGVSS